MADLRRIPDTYGPQLARARAGLALPAEVGLALREHRRRLGLSQRAYASRRGISRSLLARLEAGAESVTLGSVVEALEGTGFGLSLRRFDSPVPPTAGAAAVRPCPAPGTSDPPGRILPESWEPTDLIARVRGGGRRFPAHRVVHWVSNPPTWWWVQEFFSGPTERPVWYAPVVDSITPRLAREAARRRDAGAA